MDAQGTDERFEIALRCLCERWGCFDLIQRVQSGNSTFKGEEVREVDIQQSQSGGLRSRESDLPRLLKSDIDHLGAVTAIKQRLTGEPKEDISLEFAANNRLDLTVESLVLRPAWRGLFDETDERTAVRRLLELLSLTTPNEILPSADGDLNRIIAYLNEQIVSWETVVNLPESEPPYWQAGQVEGKERTWCESIADTGRALDEIGLLRTSLNQCDHYFGCSECSQAWPQLEKPFDRFQKSTFTTFREVSKVLLACLTRAIQAMSSSETIGIDAFAWRTIVCSSGAFENSSVWSVLDALNELESGYSFGPMLHSALAEIDPEHIEALSLAEVATSLLMEMQWFLFGNDDLIYLPSDGDLSEVPGAVVVIKSNCFAVWRSEERRVGKEC